MVKALFDQSSFTRAWPKTVHVDEQWKWQAPKTVHRNAKTVWSGRITTVKGYDRNHTGASNWRFFELALLGSLSHGINTMPAWLTMKVSVSAYALVLATAAIPARAEISEYQPDWNKDGRISIAEYLLSQQRIFRDIDTNQNGLLSVEEILSFAIAAEPQRPKMELRSKFSSTDADVDASLDEVEFLEALQIEFRSKDRNLDNFITSDEVPFSSNLTSVPRY